MLVPSSHKLQSFSSVHNARRSLRIVLPYFWPSQLGLRIRVIACVIIIFTSKAVNLAIPLIYRHLVDCLPSIVEGADTPVPTAAPVACNFLAWILLYGLLKYVTQLAQSLMPLSFILLLMVADGPRCRW